MHSPETCETRPPALLQHRWHWLVSQRGTNRIICEWVPAHQCWLPAGEVALLTPADMWRRGWLWSAAVGASPAIPQAPSERVCVFQDWLFDLTMQQQSVLLLAARGPDGIGKFHGTKEVVTRYRATVLKAARKGRPLAIDEGGGGGTFMTLESFSDNIDWARIVDLFFDFVDEIPHHYYMHLMHGAQIAGYKHPLELMRNRWGGFYERCCEDLHLNPESEEEMDARLNDWRREYWD